MTKNTLTISSTVINTFMNCREMLRFSQGGWETTGFKRSIMFGQLLHHVFDSLYKKGLDLTERNAHKLSTSWMAGVVGRVSDPQAVQELETMVAQVSALIPLYNLFWSKKKADQFKIFGSEVEYKIPFFLPKEVCGHKRVFLRGHIDALGQHGRQTWVIERKSMGQITPGEIHSVAKVAFQNHFYLFCLAHTTKLLPQGKKPWGVIYDIIRVPGIKQKKTESYNKFLKRVWDDIAAQPDHYFFRIPVEFSGLEMRGFETDLVAKITEYIKWKEGEAPHYLNNSGAVCRGRYSCDFLPVCAEGQGRIQDFGFYQKSKEKRIKFEGQ